MGFVDFAPNADLGGYPLVSVIVGAATRWQALSDSNDATYVKEETGVAGIDIEGMPNVTGLPAGAVVTGAELHARVSHTTAMVVGAFGLFAAPKAANQSPWSPDFYANANTPLGTDVGRWYYATPADSVIRDLVIRFNDTWQYNTGFGYAYLNYNQIDFSNMRILYGYNEWPGGTGNNRLYKLFVRFFYNSPPTVGSIQPADLSAGNTFTTTPTIKWVYSDADGDVQSQYRVKLFTNTALDGNGVTAGTAGFNPDTATSVVFDSGLVGGAANQLTIGPKGIANATTYYAYVKVWHHHVNGQEMSSAWTASAAFTVSVTPPSTPTVTATADSANARIIIEAMQGAWNTTPYPNYFDLVKVVNSLTFETEGVRNGTHVTTMDGMHTGSSDGNAITTPNATFPTITGNIDIRALVALDGAIPAGGHYIVAKSDVANGTMWSLRITSTGALEWAWWNGTVLTTTVSGSTITLPAAKTPFWIRVKHQSASNWNVSWWYSFDPPTTAPNLVNWVTLASFTGSGSGTMTSRTSAVTINMPTVATGASAFRIYYAEIRNSSDVIVANPTFMNSLIGQTTLTDSTGKVWTINRTGANQNGAFVSRSDYEETPSTVRFYGAYAVTISAGVVIGSSLGIVLSTPGWVLAAPYTWHFKVVLSPTLNKTFQILRGSWDAHRPADAAAFSPLGRANKVVVSSGVKGHEQDIKIECFSQADWDAARAIYEAQQVVLVQTGGQQRYLFFIDWKDDRDTIASGYSIINLSAVEVDRPAIV